MCSEADWWVPSAKYGLPLTAGGDACRTSRHALAQVSAPKQGCQMVYFQTKNPNLGTFWRALERKMFIYFVIIWNNLWPFGIIYGSLV
jgi:hypothetical protein